MSVSLDPELHVISGSQVITWRNDSDESVPSLWLHLYLNAFLNDRTTLAMEGGLPEEQEHLFDQPSTWGYVLLRSLELDGENDLLSALEYRRPDDSNPHDRTVARVLLPEPVPPGGTVELETSFESKLPFARTRTGYAGDYHFAAQWYPKLCVYESVEENPATEGWSCHQYHDHSEFHADFGTYDVEITVPSEYGGEDGGKVGATGVLRSSTRRQDGSWTYAFEQDDVHDFTWAADPDFLVVDATYDHDERRTPAVVEEERVLRERIGVPAEQLQLPDVRVRLLLQPAHAKLAERHFEAAFQAITWYGLWFGPYPYETLTIVDPQHDARPTGGMEYPTLFTAGTRWLSPEASLSPEMVTVHEFGHQYFYGLLANDEASEAWLDEGFNSYADDKVAQRAWGGRVRHSRFAELRLPIEPLLSWPSSDARWDVASVLGFEALGRRPESFADLLFQHARLSWAREVRVEDPLDSRRSYLESGTKDDVLSASWQTYDRGSYRSIAYAKPALLLTQLERVIGRERFLEALRVYVTRFRFEHPTSADFLRVLEDVTGYPAAHARSLMKPEILDHAVGSVEVEELEAARGLVPVDDGYRMAVPPDEERELHRSSVKLRRLGTLSAPVEIDVRFEGAEEPERFEWDGKAPWHELVFLRPEPVVEVVVDPETKLTLDADFTNNRWREDRSHLASTSWAARVLVTVQSAMLGGRTLS